MAGTVSVRTMKVSSSRPHPMMNPAWIMIAMEPTIRPNMLTAKMMPAEGDTDGEHQGLEVGAPLEEDDVADAVVPTRAGHIVERAGVFGHVDEGRAGHPVRLAVHIDVERLEPILSKGL